MPKTRINWKSIRTFGVFAIMGTMMAAMVAGIVKEEGAKENVRDVTRTTSEQEQVRYALIDADTIEVKKGELSHVFNFDFGHVIIMGKVNDQKVDTAFTFDQFGKQDRIEQIKMQGCAIAAKTMQALHDKTDKDSVRAHGYARLFQQNHCPKVVP